MSQDKYYVQPDLNSTLIDWQRKLENKFNELQYGKTEAIYFETNDLLQKPTEQGSLFWDSVDETLNLIVSPEVTLQIGQEMFIRVVNKTGSNIDNGKVVYISGALGNKPTVALADANDYNNGRKVIGVTTELLVKDEYGFVTTEGLVRGLNTSTYTEGDAIYLSETAGEFSTTIHADGISRIKVGTVIKSHITDGWIYVHIDPDTYMFGDVQNGDYSLFEVDGTLKLIGDATIWKDIDFPIIIRTTGTNIPTLATLQGNITAPQWQVSDFNVCEGQEFVHEWKEASEVYWHIHMITNGLNTTDRFVKWEVEWFWVNVNSVISANYTQSYEYTIPANTASKTMKLVSIYSWTPVAGKIGGHCYARLRRIASAGAAPTLDPWCTMLQLHIECDTIGSRDISSK